jgi:hypothetical protein
MAEFVNGYEAMGRIGPRVSFWFSTNKARRPVLLAEKIAYKISKAGYGYYRRRPWHYGKGNKERIWAVELQWD